MVKFQSYLAGFTFAVLLFAHSAMALLDTYPANQYLWHVNIAFARVARPLLQHLDVLAGGSSAVTIVSLSGLALVSILAARSHMRLLAAVNCHIALVMLVVVAARFHLRTYPGLPAHDRFAWLAANLSVVQYGIAILLVMVLAACLVSHLQLLRHAIAFMKRRAVVAGQGSPTPQA